MSDVAAELASVLADLLDGSATPPSSSTSYQYVRLAPGWCQIRMHDSVARALFGAMVQAYGVAPDALKGHDARVDALPVGAPRFDPQDAQDARRPRVTTDRRRQ